MHYGMNYLVSLSVDLIIIWLVMITMIITAVSEMRPLVFTILKSRHSWIWIINSV